MSARLKSPLLLPGLSAIIAPVIVSSGYLYASRGLVSRFSVLGDYSALAVAVIVGITFTYRFAKTWGWSSRSITRQTSIVAIYTSVASVFLFFYSLVFVCLFFDYCLESGGVCDIV